MALVPCPDCGWDTSTLAEKCPQCGRPVATSPAAASSSPSPKRADAIPVLGQSIDIRELRILRALFGETKGRILEAYQDAYYGPALQALVKRGLVKQVEKRYCMTNKGAEFCRAYLKELFETWQPGTQVRT